MATLITSRSAPLAGQVLVPGDKSISHRALLLGAVAHGETSIEGLLGSEDVRSTAECLRALGVEMALHPAGVTRVWGGGFQGLRAPAALLDVGNSGTSLRLLLGVLAGRPFAATLAGDQSLARRPNDHLAAPLQAMGARVEGRTERCLPPVTVQGGPLRPLTYRTPVASAQLKSALLLAGAQAAGITAITEPSLSRDHTERMLGAMGASLHREGTTVTLRGPAVLRGVQVVVPGDISSAAFFLVAACLVPGSQLIMDNVGVNPTRAGILEVLAAMGARLAVTALPEAGGEPRARIVARAGPLRGVEIGGELIPRLLDEVPILAVAACAAAGRTIIRDAAVLRIKESDRLHALAVELGRLGAAVSEREDGLVIKGGRPLQGGDCDCYGDHRIAMSLAVAGLTAAGEVRVHGAECIATSYPSFADHLAALGAPVGRSEA